MTPDAPTVPAPRRGLVLLAMTGSLSMIFIDITVVSVSLPEIGASLGLDQVALNWIVNAYLLALAAGMALGGRLGDLSGKVRAFAIGVVLFAIASAVCGLAANHEMMLGGRIAQGLAACLMQPASAAIVIGHFAPGERGKAMAVYVGIPMLFMSLGPALGGLITETLGWPWIFWLNLPIAAATLLLLAMAKPQSPPSEDRAVDWLGGVQLIVGLPLVVWAVQESGTLRADGSPRAMDADVLAAFAVGLAMLGLFVRRQLRLEHPLLRLRLFADPQLRANALLIGLTQFAMAGLIVQGSLYAQHVLGMTPFRAGLSLLPLMIPVLILVHVAGRRYDRAGVRPVASLGTLAGCAGLIVMGFGYWIERYLPIGVGLALLGAGVAFIMSPANTDALSRAGDSVRGQVSGLVQTFRQLGSTAGIAIAATISIAAQGTESAKAFYAAAQHALPNDATPTDDAIEAADPTDATILDDEHRSAFARGTAYASFAGAAAMLVGFGVARRMRPLLPPGREVGGVRDAGASPSIGADAASRRIAARSETAA